MSTIKIAFFDVDGTLIDMNTKIISDTMINTLNKLKEKGILICMATGRPSSSIPVIDGVEFDVFLTFNASYCFNKKEVIFSNPIASDDVTKIINNAEKMNHPVSIATSNRVAANGNEPDLEVYYNFAGKSVIVADDFDEMAKEEIFQIMVACRKEEYDMLLEGTHDAKITTWWERAVDIIPKNGGKGKGVMKVLEYYGLSKEDAIAFGDGANDIEMLEAVGKGIAMGNASDDVKRSADGVCGSVSEEGIYYYCLENDLIE